MVLGKFWLNRLEALEGEFMPMFGTLETDTDREIEMRGM